MRGLSPTLLAAQQAKTIDPLVKIELTHGASSYTYTRDRILARNHPEGPWSQTAKVLLDNSDGALTDLPLQGYQGVISYGAVTPAGEEYSACAPLTVIAPRFDSSPGKLTCELSLIGIPNFLALDEASRNYIPDENDDKTIETLLTEIMGASLGCFSHCKAYDVVVDSRDGLINTYKPKDSFRIYKGNSRLAIAKKLLGCTECVMLAKADGRLHIFVPQIDGTPVYTYSLASGHTFFSKAYRKALVIPNYIYCSSPPPTVPNWVTVTSDPYTGEAKDQTDIDKFGARKHTADYGAGTFGSDAECATQAQLDLDGYIALHDPYYEGVATDPDSIAALATDGFNGEIREYWEARFEDDDQAKLVAEARLSKHTLNAEMGAADVPLNVGAEVYDYIKVTDEREGGSERKGTMGSLTRHYNAEEAEWRMTLSLGQRPKAVDVMAAIEEDAPYFGRLIVDNLYAKNILADSLDMYWIDPDGNIDLSKIGDTLDNLPDGEVYARVKTLHLDAGEIKLDEHILYKAGYNPTEKMPGDADLDDIPDGDSYQRVKSAALTAAGLVILDQVVVGTYGLVKTTDISAGHIKLSTAVKDGEWYDEGGVVIDATKGIGLYGGQISLKTYPTKADYEADTNVQCYVGTDGKLYAGAGNVIIDTGGITIKGGYPDGYLRFKDGNAVTRGVILGYDTGVVGQFKITAVGAHLVLNTDSAHEVQVESNILCSKGIGAAEGFGTEKGIITQGDVWFGFCGDPGAGAILTWGGVHLQDEYESTLWDIMPYNDDTFLGESDNKFSRGYFDNLPACPVPTSNSALAVIRKIKAPQVMGGKYGKRHYFKDEDFPDEMKMDIGKRRKRYHLKGEDYPNITKVEISTAKEEGKEIEFIRTIGILVQSVRELDEKVEALEARL